MRRVAALVPATLVLLTACQQPEVVAFRQHPRPVVVACTVTPDSPRSKDFADTLEAALRVRLASRVTVVPEGIPAPPGAVRLEVVLKWKGIISPSGHAAAVGVGVGTTVGVLSAAAGDRDWFFDGLFWGLFAGSSAASDQDRYAWLGYYPDDLSSEARLMQAGDPEPLAVESISTSDILSALEPLRGNEGSDETRVEEAEAQAYARVLVDRLTDTFQWRRGAPSYYRAPVEAPQPPAPAPQSIKPAPEPMATPDDSKDQPQAGPSK